MTTQRPPLARFKIERAITRVVDSKAGRIHAVVSTESKDRQGDIIRQAYWNLDSFQKHPVLLSSHDYGSLRSQIGEWEEMAVNRKRLEGTARYYIGEGNQEADWAFNLAAKGRAAYSVGFIPDMAKAKRIEEEGESDPWFGSWEYMGQELLEVSHVTVPANPDALQQMKAMRGLHPVMAQVVADVLGDTKAEEETTVQTLILSKDTFETEADATKWVKAHDFKVPEGGADETEDSWRYRQRDPGDFAENSFRTIEITTGVQAVVGHLKALLTLPNRKVFMAEILKELRKDAHSDMADMKKRMEQMRDSMDGMATMMGDMMDEMKSAKAGTLSGSEGLNAAIQQGLREALQRC